MSDKLQKIYEDAKKDKYSFTDKLSRYAWYNSNSNKYAEMITEAWSEYKNNPNPREIATKIGTIIEEKIKDGK